jgi:pimeloyl-ACP methyl ester carboxylesterase
VLDALAPARRRLVLLLTLGLLLAVLGVGALVVLRAVGDQVRPVPQGKPGPVLLVSGYGGSTGSLEPVRRALEAAGRDVVVVSPVGAGTGDLRWQARSLADQADAAVERFGASSVDVVGYSAGGVVARLWVRDLGGASLARRVLSVGSPQHGTSLAELAVGVAGSCPTACRQLAPDSDLLRRLNAGDETPRGPVFVSVWSSADRTVVPPDSARLAGALDFTVQSVCPSARTSHGGLPADPVVLAALGTTLGSAAPRPPTGLPCPPPASPADSPLRSAG